MANEHEDRSKDQGKRTIAGSLQGYEFQAMLTLSLVMKAGVLMPQDDEFQCTIAWEDATAGKFDDATFRCKYRGVENVLNIQAKNRMAAQPIEWSEFLGEAKKDFSLVTYFDSFRMLKLHHGDDLDRHHLVLCTNADLYEEVMNAVEKVMLPEAIDIFSPLGTSCYRFTTRKLRAAGKFDAMKSVLRNCSDSYRLAHLLAETIFKEKELDLSVNNPQRAKLVYTYKLPLRKLVGECRGKGIYDVHDNFITGSGLSAGDVLFRKDFKQAYQSLNKELVNIWDDVKTKGIKLKTNKQGKIDEQTTKKDDQSDNLPTDTVTDEDIATFLRLFIIVAKADDLPAKITTLISTANVFGLSTTQLGSGEMDIAYKYAYTMIYDWMKQQSDLPTEIKAPDVRRLLKKIGLRIRYLELKFLGSNYLDSWKDKKLCHSQEHLRSLPLHEFLQAPESTEHRPLTAFPFYSRYDPEFAAWIVFETMQLGCNDMDPLEICFIDATKEGGARAVQDVLCQVDLSLAAIITCADKRAVEHLVREINETIAALEQTSRVPNKKLILVAQITENETTQEVKNSMCMEHLSQEGLDFIVPGYGELKLFGTGILLKNLVGQQDDVSILLHFQDLSQRSLLQESLTEQHYQRVLPWYIEREFEVLETPNTKASAEYSSKEGDNKRISRFRYDTGKLKWHDFGIQFRFDDLDGSKILDVVTRQRVALPPLPVCEEKADNGPYSKVHILLEEAGFGKSTYVSWLGGTFQRANPSHWVIRFNSIDYSTDFKRLLEGDRRRPLDDTEAVRFLYQMTHLALFVTNINYQQVKETDRERELGQQIASLLSFSQDNKSLTVDEEEWKRMHCTPLQLIMARFFAYQFNNRALVILLDGFDEVVPYYTDVVIDLLTRFQSFDGIRAHYITSRPHRLREKFGAVFSNPTFYQLKPFSDEDIVRMVHIFMRHEFEAYQSAGFKVGYLLQGLLAAMKYFLRSFSRVPLFIRMALNVLKPLIKEYVDFSDRTVDAKFIDELHNNFEPLTMMETFFENKVLNAIVEKAQLTDSASNIASARSNRKTLKKHAEHMHSVLALFALFDATERERLRLDKRQADEYLEEVRTGKEKSGIIGGVVGDQPIFVHRTFADYFAALWLCRNRESEHVRYFLRTCFFEDHRKEMLGFFDGMLLKEPGSTASKLLSIQSNDIGQLLRQEPELIWATDAERRTIVHLLVLHHDKTYLEKDVLSRHIDINAKDALFKWSALDYALVRQNAQGIYRLLDLGADIETQQLIDVLLSQDTETILRKILQYERFLQRISNLSSTNQGFANVISELPTRAAHCLIAERQLDLHRPLIEQNEVRLTPLEYCVVNDQASMVKAMVKQGGGFDQVLAGCENSLIVQAFERAAANVLQFLIVDCKCVVPANVDQDALVNVLGKSISLNHNLVFQALIECLCRQRSFKYTKYVVSDTEEDVDRFYEAICFTYNLIDREQVIDPSAIDQEVLRLLRCALKSNNLYAAKALMQLAGLDANDLTYPLIVESMQKKQMRSSDNKSEKALMLLIDTTKGLHATDDEGRTLLHIALENECFLVAEHLIVKGAQLLQTDKTNRWNAFHYCLMKRLLWNSKTYIEQINRERKMLLDRMMEIEPFACITAKDALGRNSLHLAIVNGHHALALLILEKNTQTVASHKRWRRWETLLAETGVDDALLSILEGSISLYRNEVFQVLIECFCRRKSLSCTEYRESDHEKEVDRFYEAICFTYNHIDREQVVDPPGIDQEVLRLLRCALKSNNLYAAKAVMQLAELDANDLTYRLIVESMQKSDFDEPSILNQYEKAVILLIETTKGLDATDVEGRTLLHIALENECFLVAEHLVIQNGAQLLQTDKKNRWNAFHYCLMEQTPSKNKIYIEQVNCERKRLLDRMMEIEPFACITAKDALGRNGLHLAIVNGHHALALLILEKNTQAVAPHERWPRWETLLAEAGVYDAIASILEGSISLHRNEVFQVLIECFCRQKSLTYTEYRESDTEEDVDRFYEAICFTYNLIDREQVVDPPGIDQEVLRLLRHALKRNNLYAAKAVMQLAELDIKDLTLKLIVESMQKRSMRSLNNQNEKAVILLIKTTKGLHATDAVGRTLLHIALENECFLVAEHLVVEKGAQLLQIDKTNRWNAFHYCLMKRLLWNSKTYIEQINRERKMLLDRMMEIEPFACITAKDALGRNGLHLAIVNGHHALALLILEKNTQTVASHKRWRRWETLLAEAGVYDAIASILEGSISLHRNEVFEELIECFCMRKSLSYTVYRVNDTEKDVDRFYEAICFTYNLIDREQVVDPPGIDKAVLRLLRCALKSTNLYAAKAVMQLAGLDIKDLTFKLIVESMQKQSMRSLNNQNEKAVILLIETTKGLDATDVEGRTLLHIALENECFLVAEHLVIQNGAQLLQTDKKNRWNAFHYCLMEQTPCKNKIYIEQVNCERKRLLDRMTDIEPFACITAKDALGRNGLHLAIVNGHHALALLILEKNTQAVAPHERWPRWETLLAETGVDNALLSILEGSISLYRNEVFQVLIDCFCRRKSLSYTEYRESDHEKEVDRFYEAICFIYKYIDREQVVDPPGIDQEVLRLLRCALKSINPYAAKAVMQLAGLDVNDLTYKLIVEIMQKRSMRSLDNKSEKALILLIKTTNGLDATDAEGRTLLHIALENECFLVAEHLVVEKGAQLLQTDKTNRWNAFHYCLMKRLFWNSQTYTEQIDRERKKLFERMMELEPLACITAKDTHGRNGLHLAIVNGHHALALLILEKNTQAVAPDERCSRSEELLAEAIVVGTKQHASFMRGLGLTLKHCR